MYKKTASNSTSILGFFKVLIGLVLVAALAIVLNLLFVSRVPRAANQPQEPVSRPLSPTSMIVRRTVSALIEPGEWPTYVSETGKYAISYPPNWMPIHGYSENGGIVFGLVKPTDSQNELLIGVSIAPLPTGWHAQQVVESKTSMLPQNLRLKATQETTLVDGKTAFTIAGREERFRLIEIVVINKNLVYTLSATPYEPEHPVFGRWVSDLNSVFYAMVSSLRFLP